MNAPEIQVLNFQVMEALWTSAWSMACTPGGTRVVQKALEVAVPWLAGSTF